ncbi:MAG: hypothetical protein EOP88_16415 [Verrucomicrobiaceae bacterium]|nr:MAG: hypothetical protein EOP88_16415 [Verrucomicrobiaceae bacterium]
MQPPSLPLGSGPSPAALRPSRIPTIIITAIITTVVVSALWGLAIAVGIYYYQENSPSFAVKITAPPEAEVGKMTSMQMEVSNPTDQVQTLNTIDIADSLLDGFKVSSVMPPETSSYGGFGSSTYEFSKTIPARGSIKVTFFLEAAKTGVWTGDVDFTNPSLSFITSSTTIRVHEAGKSPEEEVAGPEVPKPPFVLGIDTPHRVNLGENFTMRVNVTNPTDSPLVLGFIDFGGTLPEGLDLQKVSPSPDHTDREEDLWSLVFSKSLAPGETLATEITIKATKAGIWTGDLDFWDESSEDPVSSSVTIRIDTPAAESPSPD